jgi:protein-tyrosine phosphatase
MKKKIIFVCLGNICRSPSAEAVMKKLIEEENLSEQIDVDSAGTIDYHQGEPADTRMKWHAAKRGYELNHRAKKINPEIDFSVNDYIIAMDNENYRDVIAMDKEKKYHNKIYQMAEFAKEIKFEEVPDPYYGGSEGFETVLNILEYACKGLLEKIKNDIESGNKK